MIIVKPFIIEINADNRGTSSYAAYVKVQTNSYIDENDQVAEKLYQNEDLWNSLCNEYIDHWAKKDEIYKEDGNSCSEWEATIEANPYIATYYMDYFNTLKLILDER